MNLDFKKFQIYKFKKAIVPLPTIEEKASAKQVIEMKKETRLIVKCKSCGGHAEAIITRPKPDEEYYFFSCKFCDHTYEMYSIPRINYGKALLKWSRRSKEADHVWSYVILTAKLDETPARYFVLYNQNEIELASEEKGVEIYNNVLSQLKQDE